MKLVEGLKYLFYLLSYLVVYPVGFPILIMLTFSADDPYASQLKLDIIFYTFAIGITIISAFALNIIFKEILGLTKNNKYT